MGTISKLKKRIIEISYKHQLSHITSCLTAVAIIEEVYSIKKSDESFVLSQGHAGVALYVVLEKYYKCDPEKLLEECGVHPKRGGLIYVSTGSLGHGLPIAVGMAFANRSKKVYCLISDGECDEGSIWESLRIIKENNLTNLKLYVNCNSYSAYKTIDWKDLFNRLTHYCSIRFYNTTTGIRWFDNIESRYKILNTYERDLCLRALSENGN